MEQTRFLTLDNLTKDILKTKPLNSRIPSDWIKAGGSIEIDKYGNWIYTDKFGIRVKYINGYPDYRGAGVVFQSVNIGGFRNRGIDKRLANKLAPNGPCEEGHVWHHSQDGHTMEEISREIHERFTHKGGYSLWKRKEQ
ncbi:MAG: HNH endonuclease [Clostridia bacterium]|nr:HNH endonuclease [Clostridia bacterium]